MKIINARNVNYALVKGMRYMEEEGHVSDSRNGPVRVSPVPVVTVYGDPMERVLFENGTRRPNPFFHLFESLWMLAGRWDADWLDAFVSDYSERFADYPEVSRVPDGRRVLEHGAYGKRWRNWFVDENDETMDQLDIVVDKLRANPLDRRCVIQMWDPQGGDLVAVNGRTGEPLRDVPCNLTLVPQIVGGRLDINVFCRSNDMVWGAYGANAVHFSVLQEYLAARIGVPMGVYRQYSVNYHVYDASKPRNIVTFRDPYNAGLVRITPIVTDADSFDAELTHWLGLAEPGEYMAVQAPFYRNSFFDYVATPMWNANVARRRKRSDSAYNWIGAIDQHSDWRLACREFLDGCKWE